MSEAMLEPVGALLANGKRLRLECVGCGREAAVDLGALVARYGDGLTLLDVQRLGRCTGCGVKGRNRVIVLG